MIIRIIIGLTFALATFGYFIGAQHIPFAFWKSAGPSDPHWSNVVLLIQPNSTDTVIDDDSGSGHTVTAVGTAALSTAVTDPFGGGNKVIAISGSSNYLSLADSDNWDYGSSPFTIEAWLYFNALSSNGGYGWYSHYADSSNYSGLALVNVIFIDDGFGIIARSGGSTIIQVNEGADRTSPTGSWVHMAVTKDSSDLISVYVGGVRVASQTDSSTYPNYAGDLNIGRYRGTINYSIGGYIYGVRITKGVARYSGASFTPPTATFPTQ